MGQQKAVWLVLGVTGSVWSGTAWYLVVLGQCRAVLCQYKAALGQCRVVLVSTWWYWVSMGRYWLVLCSTGSV